MGGGRHVVGARARHGVSLALDWARVERRARLAPGPSALATLTVLTGAEYTRRRILKYVITLHIQLAYLLGDSSKFWQRFVAKSTNRLNYGESGNSQYSISFFLF